MWLWVGMRVVGQSKPCTKSQMYDVVSCDANFVVLRRADSEELTTVSRERACEAFRMTHSITYCRAQGLTLSGIIVLADTTNPHFELQTLNMGITRATSSELVEIRDIRASARSLWCENGIQGYNRPSNLRGGYTPYLSQWVPQVQSVQNSKYWILQHKKRIHGAMELPILNHLPLSDIPRRIVLQFLRKPHPTALLIKSLWFERDTIELDDDGVCDYLSISIAKDLRFEPPRYEEYKRGCWRPIVRLQEIDGESWSIICGYDETTGENHKTHHLHSYRLLRWMHQLRLDRGSFDP